MSPETLRWLQSLVNSVSLSVGADDFEATAIVVAKAKRELADAVAAAQIEQP
jgi:hypothetical protein